MKLLRFCALIFFLTCMTAAGFFLAENLLDSAGQAKNLTRDSLSDDQNPAWSPDGSQVVFSTKRGASGGFDIWIMNSDGSRPRALTGWAGDEVNLPGNCWCAANNRICFSSDRNGNDEIWSINPDGLDLRRVTDHPAPDWEPSWSPDGRWIVFQSRRNGNWDIYKIHPDGTGLVRLTFLAADDWEPNWSPAGDRIVFQSKRTGNWDVWTMNADGSNPQNWTAGPSEDTDPSWSPDGMFIVFSSDRSNSGEPETWAIRADLPPEANDPIRITNNSAYDGAPSWSPDGRKIAFESDRSGNLDIWVTELAMEPRLAQVKDFFYVLQMNETNISALAGNQFDLLVMDYARYGDATSEFKPAEIARIQKGGPSGRRKIVLAYMSVGEAEDYRFYWQQGWQPGSPAWLGPENPDWEGNYKVRYWMSGWKGILFGTRSGPNKSYLDRIIDQGFDGVYLDIIDAYEYWSGRESGFERSRLQARTDMANLLQQIRHYARVTRGRTNFLVFPQNGADIISNNNGVVDNLGKRYLGLCDGIGQESVWYEGVTLKPKEETAWLMKYLDVFRSNQKILLAVDYIWDAQNWNSTPNKARFNDYCQKAYAKNYVPYAANKNLELNDIIIVKKGSGFNFSQPVPDRQTGSPSRNKRKRKS